MELLVDPVSPTYYAREKLLYCETLERRNETSQEEITGNVVWGREAGSQDKVIPAEICPRL